MLLKPKYEFTYIISNDGLNMITRIDYKSIKGYEVFFTPGKYSEKKIPEAYIRTKNTGFFDGFHLAVRWDRDTCKIYNLSGVYKVLNLNEKFIFIDDYNTQNISRKEILNDTINYIQVFSKNPIFD